MKQATPSPHTSIGCALSSKESGRSKREGWKCSQWRKQSVGFDIVTKREEEEEEKKDAINCPLFRFALKVLTQTSKTSRGKLPWEVVLISRNNQHVLTHVTSL
mmetsp:Transcript_45259/g.52024  ORF Transcript_45259/g.52024 Transcript_45259/m.52024 type:complete len:103 (-) Transcript_45259:7-315(-)